MMSRIIPTIVAGLGLLATAGVVVPLATGDLPNYARLTPDPEVVSWQQGSERVLWLDTNLVGVDLRVSGDDNNDAPALGLGAVMVRADESADAVSLGGAVGCLSGRTAYDNTDDAGTPSDASDDFGFDSLWLEASAGIGIAACADTAAIPAATEGTISLYTGPGENAALLEEYEIGIVLEGEAPDAPPRFGSGGFRGQYAARRVCADSAADRPRYFDGRELVGAPVTATAADGGTLTGATYRLLPDDSLDYALFSIGGSTGQITVSDLGADDHSGLDDSRLYPLVVEVRDANGRTARVHVVVQAALEPLSSNGDGRCS